MIILCVLDPAGPYLDDPKIAKEFTDAYMVMVGGFLTFPLKFPGTAVWRAMKVCYCSWAGSLYEGGVFLGCQLGRQCSRFVATNY
jgi:hypothetical protein